MKKWLYTAAGCLIAAIVAGGWIGQAGASKGDLLALLDMADNQMSGQKQVTIRYGTATEGNVGEVGLRALGKRIADGLSLREQPAGSGSSAAPSSAERGQAAGGKPEADGTVVYEAAADSPDGDGRVTLWIFSTDGGHGGYVAVKREASGKDPDGARLAEWQRLAGERLKAEGLHGQWNAAVQGLVPATAMPAGGPDALLRRIGRSVRGRELERYTDNGTISVTFSSKRLKGSVASGIYRVSLQAAVHKQSDNGEWRLTLGSPVITTEY